MSNHQLATAVPCPNVDLPESACEPVVQSIRTSKIRSQHRERVAIVYVRQSTPQQVIEHQESRLRPGCTRGCARMVATAGVGH